jgi:hypothetical protein
MKLCMPKVLLCLASVAGGQLVLASASGQDAGHDASKSEATQSPGTVNKGEDGVAVKGYDVVAYFDQKKPMKGDPMYLYQYNGATYDFISTGHPFFSQRALRLICRNMAGIAPSAPRGPQS